MKVWDLAIRDVQPLINRYVAQETHNGRTFDGRSVIEQLCYNIAAVESAKIKNGQTIKETKDNIRCYIGNIINKAYCEEIASRIYLATKVYMEE